MPRTPLILNDLAQRLEVRNADLSGSCFEDVNLTSATFDDVNLSGVTINNACMVNVHVTDANISGMTLEGFLVSDLLAAYRATRGQR